jgi:hypothetical protein
MEYCDFPFVIGKEMGSGKLKRTDKYGAGLLYVTIQN